MKFSYWLVLGSTAGLVGGAWLARRKAVPQSPTEGQVVIITGASSGIGRAYAMAFARQEMRVVLVARRLERLEAVREEIAPYAADVLVVPTDLTESDQLQALVETTLQHFGRIDILVNNAGVLVGGPLHTMPLNVIRNTLTVNLTAAISLTSLCLPSMLAQRRGKIINVASAAGGLAFPYYSVYGSSKAGLIAFSKALRRELVGTGVSVLSVLPWWTDTEMVSPETQRSLQAMGTTIDPLELVAQRTLNSLSSGEQDLYFGGAIIRVGLWVESQIPALMDLVVRLFVTPDYIKMSHNG